MNVLKPILFSTPMVQAILEGRKTMTRRVVKPQPRPENSYFGGEVLSTTDKKLIGCVGFCRSALAVSDHDYAKPKYQPGDILWVRETWSQEIEYGWRFNYLATGDNNCCRWLPSIFMPKAACRIWLKVTDVRCERVQDISYDDCLSEGMHDYGTDVDTFAAFQELWQHLNAKRGYGWDSNPWVWVISFEQCEKPESEV